MAMKFKGYPPFGAKNRPQRKNPSRSIQRKILCYFSEKGIAPQHVCHGANPFSLISMAEIG